MMAVAPLSTEVDQTDLLNTLRTDLWRVFKRDRWPKVLMAIGWIHLLFFGFNQWITQLGEIHWPHPILWVLEVMAIVGFIRWRQGRSWWTATPLLSMLTRLWGTFFIIAFNVAVINGMTGLSFRWYFPVWASLSTFGFAATAWICSIRFLVPAVAMWFVGLLLTYWNAWGFLIHGVAWWLTLQLIGLRLDRIPAPALEDAMLED